MIDKYESRRIRTEIRRVLLNVWTQLVSGIRLMRRMSTTVVWEPSITC